jgi:hypothetical protein
MEPSILLMKGSDGGPISSFCSKGWSVFKAIIMACTVVFTYAIRRPARAL